MPNWCENQATLIGTPDQIKDVITTMTVTGDSDQSVSIVAIEPMPEILNGFSSPAPTTPEPDERWAEWVAEGTWTQEEYDKRVADRLSHYELSQAALAETGFRDWWHWQTTVWGVKWGDCHTYIEGHGKMIVAGEDREWVELRYETPWGPFADEFWERFTTNTGLIVVETFHEGGMCFAGARAFQDGKIVFDVSSDYDTIVPDFGEKMDAWYESDMGDDCPDHAIYDWMDEQETFALKVVSVSHTTTLEDVPTT